jgi:alpha-L-fucosidase 2
MMKIQSPPHLTFNLVFTAMFFFTFVNSNAQNDALWYTYPAQYWNSQALHLGNGYIGASFFGGVEEEKISITEESIWLGGPFQGDWKEYGINPEASKSLPEIRKAVSQGKVKLADSLLQKIILAIMNDSVLSVL